MYTVSIVFHRSLEMPTIRSLVKPDSLSLSVSLILLRIQRVSFSWKAFIFGWVKCTCYSRRQPHNGPLSPERTSKLDGLQHKQNYIHCIHFESHITVIQGDDILINIGIHDKFWLSFPAQRLQYIVTTFTTPKWNTNTPHYQHFKLLFGHPFFIANVNEILSFILYL